MEKQGLVTILQRDESNLIGSVLDETKTKHSTTTMSMQDGTLKEMKCSCYNSRPLKWCIHQAASVISLLRSPRDVITWEETKTTLESMSKEELVTMTLARCFKSSGNTSDSSTFLLQLKNKTDVTEKEPEFDCTRYITDFKESFSDLPKRGSIELTTYYLQTVQDLWNKTFYASALSLLASITGCLVAEQRPVLSKRKARYNLPRELFLDISSMWLRCMSDQCVDAAYKANYTASLGEWATEVDRFGMSDVGNKFRSCAELSKSDWKEPWILHFMDEKQSGNKLIDVKEDHFTVLERIETLARKKVDVVPILNYVLSDFKTYYPSVDDPNIRGNKVTLVTLHRSVSLAKALGNISPSYGILMTVLQLYSINQQNLLAWVDVVDKVVQLNISSLFDRNTPAVKNLPLLAAEAHVRGILSKCTGRQLVQQLIEIFCDLPSRMQELFCYQVALRLFSQIDFTKDSSYGVNDRVPDRVLSLLVLHGDFNALVYCLCECKWDLSGPVSGRLPDLVSGLQHAFLQGPYVFDKLFRHCIRVPEQIIEDCVRMSQNFTEESFEMEFLITFASSIHEGTYLSERIEYYLENGLGIAQLVQAKFSHKYLMYLVNHVLEDRFAEEFSLPVLKRILKESSDISRWKSTDLPQGLIRNAIQTLWYLNIHVERCSESDLLELSDLLKFGSHPNTYTEIAKIALESKWYDTAILLMVMAVSRLEDLIIPSGAFADFVGAWDYTVGETFTEPSTLEF